MGIIREITREKELDLEFEGSLEEIINLFLEMNLSCIEKRDIKLMPLSEKNEIKYCNQSIIQSSNHFFIAYKQKHLYSSPHLPMQKLGYRPC